jgi:hypothetical protein
MHVEMHAELQVNCPLQQASFNKMWEWSDKFKYQIS